MLPVEQPYKTYTGLDGKPLNNGSVYFGEPGMDPITHPVTVYWDAAGTLPAAQPLRTVNGYIVNDADAPANVFYDDSYSETVIDSKGRTVFYAPTSADFSIGTLVSNLFKSGGAAGMPTTPSTAGASTGGTPATGAPTPTETDAGCTCALPGSRAGGAGASLVAASLLALLGLRRRAR